MTYGVVDPNTRDHTADYGPKGVVDLSVNEAHVALENAQWRRTKKAKRNSAEGDYIEILYKDQWLELCREDLLGEVCTYCPERVYGMGAEEHVANPVLYMKKTILFGARIRDGAFIVIDDSSDLIVIDDSSDH